MRTLSSMLMLAGALAAPPAVAQQAPFVPKGEVRFHSSGGMGSGASFDEGRIVGPAVNLTHLDRTWTGDLAGQDVRLAGSDTKVSGPNVNLSFKQKNGKTEIEGLFYGNRVRLSVDGKKLKGRYGACSFDLTRAGPPLYSGDVGCVRGNERRPDDANERLPLVNETDPRREQSTDSLHTRSAPVAGKVAVELVGEAASDTPPAVQLGLALVAILPR